MRLEEDIDFTTLNWVKPELDEALTCARRALEDYVEEPGEDQLLRTCKGELHQVQGTLRMVELYGAAMVVQEMELLVQALLDGKVEQVETGHGALMRGLVQMPDYLERLQSGYRDIPIVLLPLLNDLRTCRGASVLDESELFRPNLGLALPASAPAPVANHSAAEQRQYVVALRPRFQQILLSWFRGRAGSDALVTMRDMLDQLTAHCHELAARRLWWITAAVLDGLGSDALDAHGNEVKRLIGRVDRCMRALADEGEAALERGEAIEIEHRLLYYVAHAKPGNARLQEVADTYRLTQLLPDAKEVEHARGSLAGHNRELLNTVAGAIKDDLLSVKDALDLFLHQASGNVENLGEQVEVLDRVGDTLGMLGLNVPRRVVEEQRGIIHEIATRARDVDENLLLDVAGALLYVEASLDDHIDRLGGNAPVPDQEGVLLPPSEARHVVAALMRETVGNISRVKGMLVAFIESPWQHAELTDAPLLLEEVSGALRMINAMRPMQLVQGISRFITNELIIDLRIPTAEQMDHLADALASVEYYLESARESQGGMAHLLDVAERSLADLGYWPMPALRSGVAVAAGERPQTATNGETGVPELTEPVGMAAGEDLSALVVGEAATPDPHEQDLTGLRLAETGSAAEFGDEDGDWEEIEEEVEVQVPVPDTMAAQAGFQGAADEIDAEIREVFLDEVDEEISRISSHLLTWKQEPADLERLRPIRRAFHTLKGSGRLVGAQVLGEFSWKIENLLNRVLDGAVAPHGGVQDLVEEAVKALQSLHETLRGGPAPTAPLQAICEVADRMADGDTGASLASMPARAMQTVRKKVKRKVRRVSSPETLADELPTAGLVESATQAPASDSKPEPGEPAPVIVTDSGESLAMRALPPMDPVLVEILRSEVVQHLGNIRACLAESATADVDIDETLMRSVHTLNGAIAMVDIAELSAVLSPLESWLKRLRAMNLPVPAEEVDVLRTSASLIEDVAAQFDAEQPRLPDTAALAARIEQLRDSLPETHMSHPLYMQPDVQEKVPDQAADSAVPADDFGLDATRSEATDADVHEAPDTSISADADRSETGMPTSIDAIDFEPFQLPADEASDALPETSEEGDMASMPSFTLEDESDSLSEDETSAELDEGFEIDLELGLDKQISPEASVPEAAETPTGLLEQTASEPEAHESVPASALGSPSAGFRFPTDAHPEGDLDLPDLDAELLDIFIEEGNDLLDNADAGLARLRREPDSHEVLLGVQRDLHTLKGSARMAGLAAIGDLSHAMESLLVVMTEGRREVDADVVESLERGCDALHVMVRGLLV